MRKYNPALKGMVENYRKMAEELQLDHSKYTDEELFALIEYWAGTSTGEDQEVAVMEDVETGTKRQSGRAGSIPACLVLRRAML